MNNQQINVKKHNELLKTKDVIVEFPMLTIYSLDKAVKEKKIKYTRIGNTNYFDIADIENFLTSGERNGDN